LTYIQLITLQWQPRHVIYPGNLRHGVKLP
jgi:hypothetical protein